MKLEVVFNDHYAWLNDLEVIPQLLQGLTLNEANELSWEDDRLGGVLDILGELIDLFVGKVSFDLDVSDPHAELGCLEDALNEIIFKTLRGSYERRKDVCPTVTRYIKSALISELVYRDSSPTGKKEEPVKPVKDVLAIVRRGLGMEE